MCLILFGWKVHPDYKLVLAANRDEFYERPTALADWWEDHPAILGGKDLKAGGSWLGLSKYGKFAALTNYRDPANIKSVAPSRGNLVSDFLQNGSSGMEYADRIHAGAAAYNGFNLLLEENGEMVYYSNLGRGPEVLEPGIYGLSNELLNSNWPKVDTGKQQLEQLLSGSAPIRTDDLIDLLSDRTIAEDTYLPETGVGIELERALSPMFIDVPGYGTPATTAVLLDYDDHVIFEERSFVPEGINRYEFTLEVPAHAKS